jgi:hypothetical protein
MLKLIVRLLLWLRGETLKLLLIGGLLLLVWGLISPVGTLEWWLEKGAQRLGFTKPHLTSFPLNNNNLETHQPVGVAKEGKLNCYIVYLPGVGDFSSDEITSGEEYFLDHLVHFHPNCVAVKDVFPYSVKNESLGGQRLLAPLWRFVYNEHEAKSWLGITDVLLKIRNLWRFALSADPRYGKIYNRGIADAIIKRMDAQAPIPQNPRQTVKVILVGNSGGAEVALGAALYLKERLEAKITVVSVGGVFNGSKGFDVIEHFYQLRGSQDWIQGIGGVVFPWRWLWTVRSPYNRARQQGRYTVSIIGPQAHDGPKGYFGEELVKDKGITYVDITLQHVTQLPIWPDQRQSVGQSVQ